MHGRARAVTPHCAGDHLRLYFAELIPWSIAMADDDQPKKSKRGFASMDPEKRRAIASKGGKSVPAERRSFSQNADLASKAGQKGGRAVDPANRSFSRDPELAAKAGTKGGHASHGGGRKGEGKP
jgi:general stress protein YciG